MYAWTAVERLVWQVSLLQMDMLVWNSLDFLKCLLSYGWLWSFSTKAFLQDDLSPLVKRSHPDYLMERLPLPGAIGCTRKGENLPELHHWKQKEELAFVITVIFDCSLEPRVNAKTLRMTTGETIAPRVREGLVKGGDFGCIFLMKWALIDKHRSENIFWGCL